MKDNNQNDIACFALTKFAENSFNLFGVAILPGHQGKGHLNDIYYFIGKNSTDAKIYGQINIDAKTLLKRLKLKSTVVHAIERRFIIES